jgi:carbon monoxide dehydrogenase subunit G
MDGSYMLKPNGAGTTVTYTLTVDINMPMISMFKRKAEKTIIDGALKGLKKRVES